MLLWDPVRSVKIAYHIASHIFGGSALAMPSAEPTYHMTNGLLPELHFNRISFSTLRQMPERRHERLFSIQTALFCQAKFNG